MPNNFFLIIIIIKYILVFKDTYIKKKKLDLLYYFILQCATFSQVADIKLKGHVLHWFDHI